MKDSAIFVVVAIGVVAAIVLVVIHVVLVFLEPRVETLCMRMVET